MKEIKDLGYFHENNGKKSIKRLSGFIGFLMCCATLPIVIITRPQIFENLFNSLLISSVTLLGLDITARIVSILKKK